MKRRKFFKVGAASLIGVGITPSIAQASANPIKVLSTLSKRSKDKWFHLGKNESTKPSRLKQVTYDVAVIGGGGAGMCAAISAARNGAKVVLVQDRPVLGGNASSEIRVRLNGVNRLKNGLAERETGVIEEILLHNRFDNPQESYPVWDHILYDFVTREPNIKLMLNTFAMQAVMDGDKIKSARCWQMTTETEYIILADIFIDCSGDGLIAASAGAEYRTGREGKKEFNETYAPDEADGWQMGSSILLWAKDMGREMPYNPPSYVMKYDAKKSHPKRKVRQLEEGFWWVEIGSDDDIIADYEENSHKVKGYMHGVWDWIKNSGDFPQAKNHALEWMGSLPGRRESRRFIGDYVLSERDLTEHKHFNDAIAFGGWSLDEHNPGGIENLSEPPSYFHQHFAKVYEIPFRSLYSHNINNLLFAGRNVSQTHIALSSSRIIATCSLMGQAAGTAASLCIKKGVSPRSIAQKHVNELQELLLRDDAFIPNRPANDKLDLARKSQVIIASSTQSGEASLLNNGWSRDIDGNINHWQSKGLPADIQMEWEEPVSISQVEIKCDSNVKRNIMMRKDSRHDELYSNTVPPELMKALTIEARERGKWRTVATVANNRTRLIKLSFESVKATAIRIQLQETYGDKNAKLFELRAYA
ncbi:FAD-dependent oxidoreductase [Colwellia sp. UCD-KL20]|uniref:FAD-dependent oxidoreductase n=1 Tax=Colwellia sp. UCD-KL20 TaxID=1917165 RepID=UPI000970C06D|nr:FAD-dependent oxidoreductase [Colwellia sp. UCD-KL20]